ncbi:hypothetical protein Vretimale_19147, partial [Volvox reticuliferus]
PAPNGGQSPTSPSAEGEAGPGPVSSTTSSDSAGDNRRRVPVLAVLNYLRDFITAARAVEHAKAKVQAGAGGGCGQPAAVVAMTRSELREQRTKDAASDASPGCFGATPVRGPTAPVPAAAASVREPAATVTTPMPANAGATTAEATATMTVMVPTTTTTVASTDEKRYQHQPPGQFRSGSVQLPVPDDVAGAAPVAAVESPWALRALQPLMQRGWESAAVLMAAAERALACRDMTWG